MKNNLFYLCLFLSIFYGCSSTFYINKFPTKNDFYKQLNSAVDQKPLTITLKTDSTIITNGEASANSDTLFISKAIEQKSAQSLAVSSISAIDYSGSRNQKAFFHLKSGENLTVENTQFTVDSVHFIEVKRIEKKLLEIPIENIRMVNYKTRWERVPLGLLAGGLTGLAGGLVYAATPAQKDGSFASQGGIAGTIVSGALIGGAISYIIGYDHIFYFDR